MELKGTVTTVRTEKIEVSLDEVIETLFKQVRAKAKVPHDAYIGSGSQWTTWDDCRGQGSGLTRRIRGATDPEVRAMGAILLLKEHLKDE